MGSGIVLVCSFCLSIFMGDYSEGDFCPNCDSETELVDFEEYKLRLSSSFMEAISKDRGQND